MPSYNDPMFSKACKYGIRATLFLALKTNEKVKVGVVEIARELNVPKHFLAKILQQLSKYNLISSVKGPNGGFYMSEENLESSLDKVIECIDGPEVFSSCILGLPVCSSENPCPLHVQAFAFREGLNYQLRHQSIIEVTRKIEKDNINI